MPILSSLEPRPRARRTSPRRSLLAPVLSATLLLGACGDLTVPDFNNPSLEELRDRPTRVGVLTAATGLLIGARENIASQNGYVSLLGVVGRESFVLDPADPRYVTELLQGPLDPGSPAFGGNLFLQRYENIRNANIVLNALNSSSLTGVTEAEKEAIRGFAKTIQAYDYLLVINTRGENGAPIEVDRDINDEPAPLASQAEVFAYIEQLLGEARGHLNAAGGEFPFPLSAGFDEFDTPSSFLKANWALQARVDAYTRDYASALQALNSSFLSLDLPFDYGVYHRYGAGSGETSNTLGAPTIFAQPGIITNAQLQPDGRRDARVLAKTETTEPRTLRGVTSGFDFTLYPAAGSPVPIIRNEELILLRSEARWFTGDRAGAISDLNFVRTRAGGLAPIGVPASEDAYADALLYERRNSLLFEGGHRWIDHRRFGRLSELPPIVPNAIIPNAFPIPVAECDAQQLPVPCRA